MTKWGNKWQKDRGQWKSGWVRLWDRRVDRLNFTAKPVAENHLFHMSECFCNVKSKYCNFRVYNTMLKSLHDFTCCPYSYIKGVFYMFWEIDKFRYETPPWSDIAGDRQSNARHGRVYVAECSWQEGRGWLIAGKKMMLEIKVQHLCQTRGFSKGQSQLAHPSSKKIGERKAVMFCGSLWVFCQLFGCCWSQFCEAVTARHRVWETKTWKRW